MTLTYSDADPRSSTDAVIDWLLNADPSMRWQVMRDLTETPAAIIAAERSRVALEGWGPRLLDQQVRVDAAEEILVGEYRARDRAKRVCPAVCVSAADGCQGEGLGSGNRDATDALIAGCVPRHQ